MRTGRKSDYRGSRRLLAATMVACVGLLTLAASAFASPRMDYGDAPDGAGARYSIPVLGKFPSLKASNGPRHRSSGPSLGPRRDREGDSKQVDRDRFDDGVSLDRLGRCSTSQLTVLIDTRKIPARLLRKNDLYLNSWFDWDRSGAWGEFNGCPGVDPSRNNEWAIVNQRISGKAFSKQRVRAFSFRFVAGAHRGEFWMRTTLTLGQKLPINALSRSGGATPKPYAYGETEDYLIRRGSVGGPPILLQEKERTEKERKAREEERREREKEAKEREEKEREEGKGKGKKEGKGNRLFEVGCAPIIIRHGRAARVRFSLTDEGIGPIFGTRTSPGKTDNYRTRLIRHSNQGGVPWGFFRVAGFEFKSRKVHARFFPEVRTVRFVFKRGKATQVLRCLVIVIHDRIAKPKKPHRPAAVPPPPPPPPPVGQQPAPQPQPEQPAGVRGQGSYQATAEPDRFHMGVSFDQPIEGFKIELIGEPPPFMFNASGPGGMDCEVDGEGRWLVCAGGALVAMNIAFELWFDGVLDPDELEGRLALYAIQGGELKGPFPIHRIPGSAD